MITAAGAYIAKSALMTSPLGGFLKAVPRRAWIALIIALVVAFAVWRTLAWHGGKVEDFGKERYAAGYSAAVADMTALQRKREARDAKITAEIRSKNDEENRRIAAVADDLRLRGAGRASAACLPASPGRYEQAGRTGDAAGSQVPPGERATVPWGWLVDRAEQHDAFRTEALSWREWHKRLTAEWEKTRRKAAEPSN